MEKQRTPLQNRSMHKLFNDISLYCIEHGIDMQTVLAHMQDYRVQVSTEAVKATWKAIQASALGKHSTTELTTSELKSVQEEFGKMWSEITGQHFEWPSAESQNFAETYGNQ